MDYEKKYKEALERAREWYNKTEPDSYTCIVESIFPELKESEDEKIRKAIITHCRNTRCVTEEGAERIAKWISWLEKQEQKPSSQSEFKVGNSIKEKDCTTIYKILEIYKDGSLFVEDNLTIPYSELDKWELVKKEPKFNEGDILKHNKANIICKVLSANVGFYCLMNILGGKEMELSNVEKNFHLWTIQDAKDGDVLSNGKMIVILKHFEEPSYRQHIVAYIGLDTNGNIQITDDTWNLGIDKTHPATKEQRDLLFKKIHEAGYMWDSDSKQLLSLKAEPNNEKKHAWSEEDERLCSCLIEEQEKSLDKVKNDKYGHSEIISDLKEMYKERIDWLQSIKQRHTWKPSDEQMKNLESLYHSFGSPIIDKEVKELIEQLKAL